MIVVKSLSVHCLLGVRVNDLISESTRGKVRSLWNVEEFVHAGSL
jgi:hypothetical protein